MTATRSASARQTLLRDPILRETLLSASASPHYRCVSTRARPDHTRSARAAVEALARAPLAHR